MSTNELTAQESFRVINEMIGKARRSFMKMSFYFLLWGVLTFLAALTEFILTDLVGYTYGWVGWPVVFVLGGIIASVKGARDGKKAGATTFTDRLFAYIWSTYVVTLVLIITGCVFTNMNPGPFVMLLTGLPTLVSGLVLRFKPLIAGGVVFWLGGIISLFLLPEYSSLVFCGTVVLGYIIPGILLKRHEDE